MCGNISLLHGKQSHKTRSRFLISLVAKAHTKFQFSAVQYSSHEEREKENKLKCYNLIHVFSLSLNTAKYKPESRDLVILKEE